MPTLRRPNAHCDDFAAQKFTAFRKRGAAYTEILVVFKGLEVADDAAYPMFRAGTVTRLTVAGGHKQQDRGEGQAQSH